jgi:hypothetical protein
MLFVIVAEMRYLLLLQKYVIFYCCINMLFVIVADMLFVTVAEICYLLLLEKGNCPYYWPFYLEIF